MIDGKFIDIQGLREQQAANRQNFALSTMEGQTPDEQVRSTCRAGVSDPLELASLLGRPLEETDKRLMFIVLMWGEHNSAQHPAFEQSYREWKSSQKWE